MKSQCRCAADTHGSVLIRSSAFDSEPSCSSVAKYCRSDPRWCRLWIKMACGVWESSSVGQERRCSHSRLLACDLIAIECVGSEGQRLWLPAHVMTCDEPHMINTACSDDKYCSPQWFNLEWAHLLSLEHLLLKFIPSCKSTRDECTEMTFAPLGCFPQDKEMLQHCLGQPPIQEDSTSRCRNYRHLGATWVLRGVLFTYCLYCHHTTASRRAVKKSGEV